MSLFDMQCINVMTLQYFHTCLFKEVYLGLPSVFLPYGRSIIPFLITNSWYGNVTHSLNHLFPLFSTSYFMLQGLAPGTLRDLGVQAAGMDEHPHFGRQLSIELSQKVLGQGRPDIDHPIKKLLE
jgi:hypothetical protein